MNDTREYILDTAYGLFLSRSYEAVSISEISKAIGFTKGALYHHFASKEELFKAVIDKYLILNSTFVDEDSITLEEYINKAVANAQSILNSILVACKDFAPLNYISLFIDALRHYPSFTTEKENLISGEIEKIKTVLNRAIEKKEIRADIDVSITALNFFSLLYGVAGNLVQSNSVESTLDLLKLQLGEMYKVIRL